LLPTLKTFRTISVPSRTAGCASDLERISLLPVTFLHFELCQLARVEAVILHGALGDADFMLDQQIKQFLAVDQGDRCCALTESANWILAI
jgi:hypothetical protein